MRAALIWCVHYALFDGGISVDAGKKHCAQKGNNTANDQQACHRLGDRLFLLRQPAKRVDGVMYIQF